MTQGVYEFENQHDGMAYTGGSIDIERRQKDHIRALRRRVHHCIYFQRAWDKHGEDAFVFRVIEIIEDVDMLLAAEQKRMDKRRAQGKSYNMALFAGAPMRGRATTEEHRRKNSEAHMGELNHMWGKHHAEKTKKQIGESLMGHRHTEESKQKMRA